MVILSLYEPSYINRSMVAGAFCKIQIFLIVCRQTYVGWKPFSDSPNNVNFKISSHLRGIISLLL